MHRIQICMPFGFCRYLDLDMSREFKRAILTKRMRHPNILRAVFTYAETRIMHQFPLFHWYDDMSAFCIVKHSGKLKTGQRILQ